VPQVDFQSLMINHLRFSLRSFLCPSMTSARPLMTHSGGKTAEASRLRDEVMKEVNFAACQLWETIPNSSLERPPWKASTPGPYTPASLGGRGRRADRAYGLGSPSSLTVSSRWIDVDPLDGERSLPDRPSPEGFLLENRP
jgi:hypothetical protein